MTQAWFILIIAGVLEIAWAVGLKYTDGFNFAARPLACTLTIMAMIASMYLLSVAVRQIPIGTGYAIWTGIGAAGAAVLGMVLFKEPATAARIACLFLVVCGIVGLKVLSPAPADQSSESKSVPATVSESGGSI
jgi:quaternary ammonium compound-resistance protein SugE